jgi:hypothetical protein
MGPARAVGWAGADLVGHSGSAQIDRIDSLFFLFFSKLFFNAKTIPEKS